MALILAIEPDRRQASKVAAIVKNKLHAELVSGDTTAHAVDALGGRVPDLILTSLLLSRKDEASLADWLRQSDEAGAHVQTLVIPVLGGSSRDSEDGGGLLSRFSRGRSNDATTGGCDPEVFAEQIREYLERAAEERRHTALRLEDQAAAAAAAATATATPPAAEPLTYVPAYEHESYEPRPADKSRLRPEMPPPNPAVDAVDSGEPVCFEVEAIVPLDAAPIGVAAEPEDSDDDSWSEIALGDNDQVAENAGSQSYSSAGEEEDAGLELTSETIDLQRFVEELSSQTVQPEPHRPSLERSDDVLADFEEALETIASDTIEPARPDGWPHLDSTVPKTPHGANAGRLASRTSRGRTRSKKSRAPAGWSTFDPEQIGFTAVLAKLDRMAAEAKAEKAGS